MLAAMAFVASEMTFTVFEAGSVKNTSPIPRSKAIP